ncbi:hypothetical protein [Fischerella sp.]|uniref:hypothetical protein n=1 Tax=Fischerella sp. TaxID=1191 RepID=UPI00345C241B
MIIQGIPYLSADDRKVRKIDSLPTNLGEAIAHLKQDDVLLNALNSQLSAAYLAVRQAEWEAMKDWDLQAEVKALLEQY